MADEIVVHKGLEGVFATESAICFIDGKSGRLAYRGYPIEIIAERCSFEETSYLLINGAIPTAQESQQFSDTIRARREITPETIDFLRAFPTSAHPMEVLQAVVLFLGMQERDRGSDMSSDCAHVEHLIAQFATVIAVLHRLRARKEIVPPRGDLSHGANFLYMLHGDEPSELAGKVMDTCLTLHAEHSLNASTFTARVVASTLTLCYNSISAAVGALYGPLHGGANERVLEMVDEIGAVEQVHQWVADALQQRRKIMGMGHRVYKTIDPRAVIIEKLLARLNNELPHNNDYPILKAVESEVRAYMDKKNKPIYPNVDFFSGAAYRMLNIPRNLFTAIFAIARISGWIAHIQEQIADNRIFRPKAKYTGPPLTGK